ncbi:MAG: Lrp/AsnC ligand binding domain-containing protein [Elusimicrobia bacterium]|nr:Lrp/AsnC ligand binding domain-containing protein [Elusimicrobiota bacterium]
MMKAFVLCKLIAGLEQKAVTQIRTIKGVNDVFLTFGSWDAVLTAEADTLDKLSGLIVREIRGIHGVQTTETLVTTNL